MQDKKNRDIVDSQGNVIKSIKDNKTKQFLKDNVWNILSTGLATTITLVEMINLVISKNFSVSCSNFYGIDGKYFDGTEMFDSLEEALECSKDLMDTEYYSMRLVSDAMSVPEDT